MIICFLVLKLFTVIKEGKGKVKWKKIVKEKNRTWHSHVFLLLGITPEGNSIVCPTHIVKLYIVNLCSWMNFLLLHLQSVIFYLNFYILPKSTCLQLISTNGTITQYLKYNCVWQMGHSGAININLTLKYICVYEDGGTSLPLILHPHE